MLRSVKCPKNNSLGVYPVAVCTELLIAFNSKGSRRPRWGGGARHWGGLSCSQREALLYVARWCGGAQAGDPRYSRGSECLDLVAGIHERHDVEAGRLQALASQS